MLFHVYGSEAIPQWIAMLGVLAALILLNEFARRTKAGGIIMFFVIPAVLTVYFIAIAVGAGMGAQWALENQTHVYMNGWFHYAKLYASLAGCIGFMMIKYEWGIGKTHWFKAYPFVIVAINILPWQVILSLPSTAGIHGGCLPRMCGCSAAGTMCSMASPALSISSA